MAGWWLPCEGRGKEGRQGKGRVSWILGIGHDGFGCCLQPGGDAVKRGREEEETKKGERTLVAVYKSLMVEVSRLELLEMLWLDTGMGCSRRGSPERFDESDRA